MSKSVQFLAAICMLAVGVCFAGSQANASVCFLPDGGCNLGGGDGMGGDTFGGVTCSGSTTKSTPEECYNCNSCTDNNGKTLWHCSLKSGYEVVNGQCQRVGQCPDGYIPLSELNCGAHVKKEQHKTATNCYKCGGCEEEYEPIDGECKPVCPTDYPSEEDKTSQGFKCEEYETMNCWKCSCPDSHPYTSNPDSEKYNCQSHPTAKGCFSCAEKTEGCSEYKIIDNCLDEHESDYCNNENGNDNVEVDDQPIKTCLGANSVGGNFAAEYCQCVRSAQGEGSYYLKCSSGGGKWTYEDVPVVLFHDYDHSAENNSMTDFGRCHSMVEKCKKDGYSFEKPDDVLLNMRTPSAGDANLQFLNTDSETAFNNSGISSKNLLDFVGIIRELVSSGAMKESYYLSYTTPKEACPYSAGECITCTYNPKKYNVCLRIEAKGEILPSIDLGGTVVNVGELRPGETAYGGTATGSLIIGYTPPTEGTTGGESINLTHCFCPDGYYEIEEECKWGSENYRYTQCVAKCNSGQDYGKCITECGKRPESLDNDCTSEEIDVGYPDGTKVRCYRTANDDDPSYVNALNGCDEGAHYVTNALYTMNDGSKCALEVFSTLDGYTFDRTQSVDKGPHEVCTIIFAEKNGTPVSPEKCNFNPVVVEHLTTDIEDNETSSWEHTYEGASGRVICSKIELNHENVYLYAEVHGVPNIGPTISTVCSSGSIGYQLYNSPCSSGYSLTNKFGGEVTTENNRPQEYHLEYDPVNPMCAKWEHN